MRSFLTKPAIFLTDVGRGAASAVLALLALLHAPGAKAQPAPSAARIPAALGFVNFSGSDLDPLVAQDRTALSPLFASTNAPPPGQIPVTPVLFVYARLNPDGTIRGTKSAGIRKVVEATKASIVVVASENSADSVKEAAAMPGPKSANLVFTLSRNGSGFPTFFRRLFERMRDGKDMLTAWVELVPQGPVQDPALPATIVLPEAGRLAFPKPP